MQELTKILSSFELASPFYFWIGGAVILLLIFFPLWRRKRNLKWERGYWIKKVPELKRGKLRLVPVLIIVTSILVAFALANPSITDKNSVSFSEKPVMAVIDISGSMGSYSAGYGKDKNLSAFEASAEVFFKIADYESGAAMGLLLYSDESYIARDFAENPEYLKDALENKEEVRAISMGTMTAKALYNARMYFSQKIRAENKTIILISDLVDNLDEVGRQMRQVVEDGINIYVIVITLEPQQAYESIRNLKISMGSNNVKMVWVGDEEGIKQICQELSKMKVSQAGIIETSTQKPLLFILLPVILGLVVLSIILSETVFRKLP